MVEKMIRIKGFTDFKYKEANQMGLISFSFMISYLFVFALVVGYIAFVEMKFIELFALSFIGMMCVVFVGLLPLFNATRAQRDLERGDFEAVRVRSRRVKLWGIISFSFSVVFLFGITYFFILT